MSIHFHIFVLSALAFVGHTFSFQLAPPSLSQITSRSASTKSSWSVLGPKAIGLDGRKSAIVYGRNNGINGIKMSLWQGKTAKDIDGKVVQLEAIAKKVTLVTNVACFCGFTKQYPGFQDLQQKFGDRFTVIAFPCNQFGGQEPGTPSQIKEFIKQFGVTFPVMDKIDVNGPKEHPLYTDLKTAQPGFIPFRKDVNWNFTKFLVVDGKCVKRYESTTEPAAIAKDVEAYLAQA